MRVTVRVPATSANLGPGFDCFGLALELCNEVVVRHRRVLRGLVGRRRGGRAPNRRLRPRDRVDAERGRRSPASDVRDPRGQPGPARSRPRIVVGRGRRWGRGGAHPARRRPVATPVFTHAAAIEGHPDNAAPACFGGFTIADPGGSVRRFDPHPALRPVAIVPWGRAIVDVDRARRAPRRGAARRCRRERRVRGADGRGDHARSVGCSVSGCAIGCTRTRASTLVPAVREVFEAVRDAGVPVCVSGAGPTLLAFPDDRHEVPSLPVSFAGGAVRGAPPRVRALDRSLTRITCSAQLAQAPVGTAAVSVWGAAASGRTRSVTIA